MRALFVLVLLASGCTPTTLVATPDAPLADAGLDAPPDAPEPIEPPGGSECDQQDACEACRSCSVAPFETCNALALACEDDTECLALTTCVAGCRDRDCTQACGAAHPGGVGPYLAFVRCTICDACPADCRDHHALWCEEPPF